MVIQQFKTKVLAELQQRRLQLRGEALGLGGTTPEVA
jgi:hypothetical protein